MALQFDHVFAGEAGRGGEIEQQAAVDGALLGIVKIAVQRHARGGRFTAADFAGKRQQVASGNTDYADTAASGGGGDGSDGGSSLGHSCSLNKVCGDYKAECLKKHVAGLACF